MKREIRGKGEKVRGKKIGGQEEKDVTTPSRQTIKKGR
jgi:hypothetical protein